MDVLQAAAESKEGLPKLLGNPGATAGHQRTLLSTRDRSALRIHVAQSLLGAAHKKHSLVTDVGSVAAGALDSLHPL